MFSKRNGVLVRILKDMGVTSTEANELLLEVDHNADDIVEGESVGHVSQQEI